VGFVVPTYFLVVTNMLLTALDKAFVGQSSSMQLASLGPSTAVFDCSSYVLTFLNTAALTLLGREPSEKWNRIRSHSLAFSTLFGAVQGLVLLLAAVPAVRSLGAAGAMVPCSVLYLQIRAVGAPIDRLASMSTQFWLAEKDGVTPMLATLIAAVVNAVGDYLLCPHYGVAGAAVATVGASAVSAAFLVLRLKRRRLWPSPFQRPSLNDFGPFASFAGPLLVALLMKVLLFALMTAAATGLGTEVGAAHQVLVSVFFVCGIAFGQPLSWAAQAYLSGIEDLPSRRRTTRALLCVAAGSIVLSGTTAWLMGHSCLAWFTRDSVVQAEAAAAMPTVILFGALYVLYLTLEGLAIAMRKLRWCLVVSAVLAASGRLTLGWLGRSGALTLRSLWGSQVILLALACGAIGLATVSGLTGSTRKAEVVVVLLVNL